MSRKLILLSFVSCLVTCFCSEIGVPVLLWQKKTDSNLFDSKSTVNQIDGKILAEDYLTNSQTIVAFIQSHLSLEQFTAEEEERLTTVKSIFKDQSIKPTLLTDVLNPTEALNVKHFQHQKWDAINVKNGDKVWVELPEDSLAENNELLKDLMANIQKNVSKNVLFLITGHKNQFQSIDLEPELSRRVREVKADPTPSPDHNEYLINVTNCLFFYTTNITVIDITGVPKFIGKFDGKPTAQTYAGSKCWIKPDEKDKDHKQAYTPGLLQLHYTNKNNTEVTLKLDIENNGNKYFWGINITTSTITIKDPNTDALKAGKVFKMTDNQIEAEQWFGFSCGKLSLKAKADISEKEKLLFSVTLDRFQLQPFLNPHNNKSNFPLVFTDSFDCEVWMTLPLWMGLLTLILMFVILSTGVYFIAIVNTPDRFENPKGKPLVISSIDE